MKIKTKLTILFTLLIAILLLILNFYIYSLSKSYSSNNFFSQLRDRVFATANIFLEADEAGRDKSVFNEFQKKYLEKLPGETIRIYDSLNHPAFIKDSVSNNFPLQIIEKTRNENVFQDEKNNKFTYGIYYTDNQGNFVILVTAIDKIGKAKLIHLRNILIIGFVFSIIIVFFIGRFFVKQVLKPLRVINKQVNKISETNLNLRLNEGNRKDELAELAITFNRMLARIKNAFELQQNFVTNASHELRTPLTSIIGNIEVSLSRQRNAEEYKMILTTVLEEAERLHKLSDGLLNIAQASFDINNMKMETIRIDELLEEVKDIIKNQMPESIMLLSFENMPANFDDLLIKGNKNLLMIAFENIFENANKFSDNKNVKIIFKYNPENILITITDSGIGIPEKDIANVMETFYRSGNARQFSGSGVGLSLSQKIFLLHNGRISIKSVEGEGTIVSVILKKT